MHEMMHCVFISKKICGVTWTEFAFVEMKLENSMKIHSENKYPTDKLYGKTCF